MVEKVFYETFLKFLVESHILRLVWDCQYSLAMDDVECVIFLRLSPESWNLIF